MDYDQEVEEQEMLEEEVVEQEEVEAVEEEVVEQEEVEAVEEEVVEQEEVEAVEDEVVEQEEVEAVEEEVVEQQEEEVVEEEVVEQEVVEQEEQEVVEEEVVEQQEQEVVEQEVVEQEVVEQQQVQVFDAMALDCALDGDFMPIKDMNEEFVLRRNFIEFHIHVRDQGDYRGNGHLVLTTKRLILVNRDDPSWGSFTLPLRHTFDEEFDEGMMGRFHINGHCRNDDGLLPNNAHFKVWFNQGGGLRFQHIYRHVLNRSREGVEFGDIMVEIQDPGFVDRCNQFDNCEEETLFFMTVQPAPVMQQEIVQQEVQQQMFDALALDCALDGDFVPIKDMNEEFVLRRNFIEFHIHVRDQGDYRGNGHLILTTKRLVLVNRDDPSWGSFSLPLRHTFDEGMMGRFHINGHCRNDEGLLPNNAHFKVWFNQGGGLRFQHIYRHVLNRSREGVQFGDIMVEIQDPGFVDRCNEFGPCDEETLFFMSVQPTNFVEQEVVQEQEQIQQQVFDALAIDCALDGDFMPIRDMNEQFVLRRNFIEFHIHVRDQGDYRGNGHLVLTTKRLILVNRDDPSWGSFSLPLLNTFNEEFDEGMMGRFHINAHCRNDGGLLPNHAHFKVWFNQGGGLRFQHIYRHVLNRARECCDFNSVMVELQDPMFIQRCNEFGPCEEETVFFMQPAPMMQQTPMMQPNPMMQQPIMQQQMMMQQQQQVMFDALALDCALDGEFMPVRDMNEQFVLRRNFIEFHIHVRERGDFRGRGHLILTTKRLVLVNREDPSWGSFSLPLMHTFDEQFEEGMMGRFHIDAHCRNDMGLLPHNAHFKVWFEQGGGLRFQHIYRHVLRRAKEGVDFNGIMLELQEPRFVERCNEFGPCNEETVFFMQGGQAIMVVPNQEPYQEQRLMQPQPEVIVEVRPQRVTRDDGYEQEGGSQNKGCCTIF